MVASLTFLNRLRATRVIRSLRPPLIPARPVHLSHPAPPPPPDYTCATRDSDDPTYVATVAIVGAPNAGKSSLSNAIVHNRVSAVSRKVNTTRACMSAVLTSENRQLLLWDTPGIVERAFVPSLGAERRDLCTEGWAAAADADIAVFVIDVSRGLRYLTHCANVASQLAKLRIQATQKQSETIVSPPSSILVFNKIDVARPRLRVNNAIDLFQTRIPEFHDNFHPHVFQTVASSRKGIAQLRNTLLQLATPGEFVAAPGTVYLDDDLQVVRHHLWEKLLHRVHQEVPYRCQFHTDESHELPNGGLFVSIIVRAPSRPTAMMVVGPNGNVLRWIREEAAKSAAQVLGRPVRLKVCVRVAKRA